MMTCDAGCNNVTPLCVSPGLTLCVCLCVCDAAQQYTQALQKNLTPLVHSAHVSMRISLAVHGMGSVSPSLALAYPSVHSLCVHMCVCVCACAHACVVGVLRQRGLCAYKFGVTAAVLGCAILRVYSPLFASCVARPTFKVVATVVNTTQDALNSLHIVVSSDPKM